MSRLEEAENAIKWAMSNALAGNSTKPDMIKLARTLAAEVDELKRRLDAVVAMLEPGDPPPGGVSERYSAMRCIGDLWDAVYEYKCEAHISAVAIAEGRDNG